MTEPKPPSPGFDLRIDTRLPPDGKPRMELTPGKRHEIVVHVPGGEPPGATVPESGKATAGLSLPKVGEKWATSAPTGSGVVALSVPLPAGRGLTPAVVIGYTTAAGWCFIASRSLGPRPCSRGRSRWATTKIRWPRAWFRRS